MKFETREDIEAPIAFVFEQMTDFKSIERAAMRRGAEVQRVDKLTRTGPGMAWDAAFDLRGKRREISLELTEYDPPNGMVFVSRSPNLSGRMVVELVSLSPGRTRVGMEVELEPKNLSAKLLVQSLKLARKSVTKRIDDRMAAYAADIEQRYRRSA